MVGLWVYGWALFVTLAAIATGAAPFLAQLFGIQRSPAITTSIAWALVAITTVLNLSGTRLLARVAMFRFVCELIGAIVVGSYLLLFARHQSFGALIDTSVINPGGSYWPAFFTSSLAAMFCYYGFEACGDVAEETPDAARQIPRAMRLTIYVGGAAALWVCLGLVLAVPDIDAVISGRDKDPVVTLLKSAMGEVGFRVALVVVLVSFVSCLLSLQAAASRLLFSYARDEMIIGSRILKPAVARQTCACSRAAHGRRDPHDHRSVGIMATGRGCNHNQLRCDRHLHRLPDDCVCCADRPIARLASAGGIYAWRLGLASQCFGINVRYRIGAIINMAWPRSPNDPWYVNYAMIVTTASVLALVSLYMIVAQPYNHGAAPAGDAHRLGRAT